MGKFYDHIPQESIDWIRQQHVFWVATAPLSGEGHVNVSPKGVKSTFHVDNANRVWYEDLTGSGNETVSHLRENGRITILFSAFEGPPKIARLFGTGKVHEFGTLEYDTYISVEKRQPGSRAVIVIDVHKVGTSCGWGVPYFKFHSHRPTLNNWSSGAEKPGAKYDIRFFWDAWNKESMDGLPGLTTALITDKKTDNNWKYVDPRLTKMRSDEEEGRKNDDLKPVVSMKYARNRIDYSFISGVLVGVLMCLCGLQFDRMMRR